MSPLMEKLGLMLPAPGLYLPAPHAVHTVAASPENLPVPHSKQLVPSVSLYVPGRQAVQLPGNPEYPEKQTQSVNREAPVAKVDEN